MNMKTKQILSIKNVALVALALFLVLNTQTAQAQKKNKISYRTQQAVTVGDLIQINKDSLYYLTGERMSKWVYGVKHTVQQVGSRTHPEGVLLKGILSWVYADALIPISIAAPPIAVPAEPTPTVETPVADTVVVSEKVVADSIVTEPVASDSVASQPIAQQPPVVEQEPEVLEEANVVNQITNVLKGVRVQETYNYGIPISYEADRLSLGLRGGFASTLTNGLPLGYDAWFDLQYASYWAQSLQSTRFGILTGANVGFMCTKQSTVIDDKFTTEGIDYHISATSVDETLYQVLLEVPVMFSMLTTNGFFLNLGPKLMLPVYTPVKQTIADASISAYLPELNGKPITNEVVTGALTNDQANLSTRAGNEFKLALSLGLELGYEITLENENSISLGVYTNYGVYSMYKNTTDGKIISLVAPTETSSAVVTVNPMTNIADKIGHLDAGIKVSFNFNFADM